MMLLVAEGLRDTLLDEFGKILTLSIWGVRCLQEFFGYVFNKMKDIKLIPVENQKDIRPCQEVWGGDPPPFRKFQDFANILVKEPPLS